MEKEYMEFVVDENQRKLDNEDGLVQEMDDPEGVQYPWSNGYSANRRYGAVGNNGSLWVQDMKNNEKVLFLRYEDDCALRIVGSSTHPDIIIVKGYDYWTFGDPVSKKLEYISRDNDASLSPEIIGPGITRYRLEL